MNGVNRKWTDGMATSEDWWAVWLGLIMFVGGFLSIWGVDAVGWMAKTKGWLDPGWKHWVKPASKGWKSIGPLGSFLMTYGVFTVFVCIGAFFMKLDMKKFFIGWTCIFFITWGSWIAGHNGHFKFHKTIQSSQQPEIWGDDVYCATKVHKCSKKLNKALKKMGVDVAAGQAPTAEQASAAVDKVKKAVRMSWGLQLGGGFSYMLSLAVGLFIGNFMKGFAGFLREAAKPEWYIKTAIVYLGIKIGMMSMKAAGFMFELAIAGMCATIVAYMIFWPIVYALGRKAFALPRGASAVMASGISICGVSAAIATAGAIRAKAVLPVMVSMLIVVFAMFELIVLPGLYVSINPGDPIVNGAAMGLTVKTDGADAAAGAILDELERAWAQKQGIQWEEGSILAAAVMTKIWIDMFIGVWAFVLAIIWVYKVERKPGQSQVPVSEIWFRFPKFVLGYFFCWFAYVAIAVFLPEIIKPAMHGAKIVQSPMRKMMFMLCFVSIGVITDFSKLKGMGKLTLLYAIALFLIIAPIAYLVAWIFHHGMMPPLATP